MSGEWAVVHTCDMRESGLFRLVPFFARSLADNALPIQWANDGPVSGQGGCGGEVEGDVGT